MVLKKFNLNYLNIFKKNNLIILISSIYLFFWDFFLTLGIKLDIRIVLFLLSFFIVKEIFKDIKNKNYNFLYLSLFILLSIIFHSLLSDNALDKKFYLSLIFLIYIFGIAYYLGEIILINKIKIIYLFISIFLISILINYLIGFSSNPEPFSCGGLKNLISGKNNFDKPIFFIHFISSYSLIFNENSHLAMSSVPILIYTLYLFTHKIQLSNNFGLFILILFIIILFLKSSATLLAGSFFSILAIILFEYKRINKYFIFFSLILSFFLIGIFFSDKVCKNKINLSKENIIAFEKINPISKTNKLESMLVKIENLVNNENINFQEKKKSIDLEIEKILLNDLYSVENKEELIKFRKNLNQINNNIELKNFFTENLVKKKLLTNRKKEIKNKNTIPSSLSSDVFFHAMKVTYNSFLEKPFGWGFQGYELAFNQYNKKYENLISRKSLMQYNSKDASSNFFKIITEFGILNILLFSSLLYIICSKKISLENKIFLFPFLITQFIRGAGYFNGGFILILFILLLTQFKFKKINS